MVQLIDASSFWVQKRKTLGDKRREIPLERTQDILRILADFKDGDTRGENTREILGVPVRLTSPARTVVDCFRYRSKLGIDIALEAPRDAVRSHKATTEEIVRAAEVCRAGSILRPYLEGLEA